MDIIIVLAAGELGKFVCRSQQEFDEEEAQSHQYPACGWKDYNKAESSNIEKVRT